jgi:hypothetical protein
MVARLPSLLPESAFEQAAIEEVAVASPAALTSRRN